MADHRWTSIDDRVVEIKVPLANNKERLGTGFVISPHRVLTALHVIIGSDAMQADTRIAAPARIMVRTLGDFRRRFGDTRDVIQMRGFERLEAKAGGDYLWRPAALLWPTEGSEIPRFEFAVLHVEASEEVLATFRVSTAAQCAWPVEEARCRGYGFATWNRIQIAPGVTVTDLVPIRGWIEPATGRIQSLQSLTIESATPPRSDDWQGLSGAALFDEQQRLLGIASAAKPTARNSGLGVSLLADIVESPEFDGFWIASGVAKPTADQPGHVAVSVDIPACPYPGLTHFTSDDADLFFGRDSTVDRLVKGVAKRSVTALVGPSGSGKSSVILAGLVPRLHQGGKGRWRVSYFRIGTAPDKDPFVPLAQALADLCVAPSPDPHQLAADLEGGRRVLGDVLSDCQAADPAKRILLIADQFEEVFTLVEDETRRNRFIDVLLSGFPLASVRPTVAMVLTLRADFYGFALRHQPRSVGLPSLSDVLQAGIENLGPMTREELRACIERPAQLRGVSFAPGLVNRLLDEVEGQPGLLPLLEFALREMWERQEARQITHAAHWAIEGVEGALEKHADHIFDLKTDNETNDAAIEVFRRLFMRLVNTGEGQGDTRRVARRGELGDAAWALAQDLAGEENRLVVTSAVAPNQETVEVAHEALIRHWPRLVKWLGDDRSFQGWLRRIGPSVQLWSMDRNDDAPLLRGRMLIEGAGWLGNRRSDCSMDEIAFLEASIALQRRSDAEKEATRQAEADRQRHLAVSQSLRLAIAARSVIDTAPETALLLAGEAMRYDWNPVSDEVLRETLETTHARVIRLSRPGEEIIAVAFDAAGHVFTLSDAGWARRFDAEGRPLSEFRLDGERLVGGALRPDGGACLAVAMDGAAQLYTSAGGKIAALPAWKKLDRHSRAIIHWTPEGSHALCVDGDAAWLWSIDDLLVSAPWDNRPTHKKLLSQWSESRRTGRAQEEATLWAQLRALDEQGHKATIFDAAFSPDGKTVATASADGTVQLWDLTGHHLQTIRDDKGNDLISVSFSQPDGVRLLAGGMDRNARLWDRDGTLVEQLRGHGADVRQVAFSPDGALIATAVNGGGNHDGKIRLWDPDGRFLRALEGHTDYVGALAFSSDGRLLASGSRDSTIRLWVPDGACLAVLHGHVGAVIAVALDQTSSRLLSVAHDGEARLWRLAASSSSLLVKSDSIITAAAYWGDDALVVSSSYANGPTLVSSALDGGTRAVLPGVSARSPGAHEVKIIGNKLWTVEPHGDPEQGSVRLHSVSCATGNELVSYPPLDVEGSDTDDAFRSLILAPDGDGLLVLRTRTAQLCSAVDRQGIVLDGPNCNAREKPSVDFAAFSTDGLHLVTASINGSLWLWRRTGELARARLIDGSSARDNLFSIAVSSKGWPLLTTVRGQADLWDSALEHVATLRCETNKVKRGLFSADGSRILTIGEDAFPDMRLWDASGSLVEALQIDGHVDPNSVVLASAAPLLAWPTDRTLHVFDLDGRRIARLATALDKAIRVFAFDSTGTKVAIGSYGTGIQVWSLDDGGRLLTTLKGHSSEINSLQFDRSGKRLLTASSDGTVRQFVVETGDLLAEAERRIGRILSQAEIDRYAVPLPLRFRPGV